MASLHGLLLLIQGSKGRATRRTEGRTSSKSAPEPPVSLPHPLKGPGLTSLEELSFGLQLLNWGLRQLLGQVVTGKLLQKGQ